MTVEIKANEFCPDNCKYYVQSKEVKRLYADGTLEWVNAHEGCQNAEVCRYAYELGKAIGERTKEIMESE